MNTLTSETKKKHKTNFFKKKIQEKNTAQKSNRTFLDSQLLRRLTEKSAHITLSKELQPPESKGD